MPTGYVTEILGDDRVWESALPENSLTGWPIEEYANLAILNRSSTKTVTINTLDIRPRRGPQGTTPIIDYVRITALSDGTDVDYTSFDSNNAALPSQVLIKYAPTTLTITANTIHRRQLTYTGMNIDRAMQRMASRMTGCSQCNMDYAEMGSWVDSGIQKTTFREGEGFALQFDTNSGSNVFLISVILKNSATGETYYIDKMIEPLFMAGAPALALLNGAGSGVILEVQRVQIREIGDDQIPLIDFLAIDGCAGMAANAQVIWADSSDSIPTDIDIKKNVFVRRAGFQRAAIFGKPRFRTILGGESPYGPDIAGGPNIAGRGMFSYGYRNKDVLTAISLGPGQGIAVLSRNPSSNMYAELIANITVNIPSTGGGTYPAQGDVRTAITYGPTGADYTGNILLPVVGDVRVAISYGANGTEATGTLVPGGGGGNRIFYPGGWH